MLLTPKKQVNRKKKSERLSSAQKAELKKVIKKAGTMTDAAIEIGVMRCTIDSVLNRGTAHPETIKKISEAYIRLCKN